MNGSILTIGDELLIGQVVNTNQAYIAQRLNDAGVAVARMVTVGDSMPAIIEAFRELWQAYDIVVVTGGLGPTHDDITKTAVCTFFDSPLEKKDELLAQIKALLERRNIPWRASHEEQALFPSKAIVVPNPRGTAAGMRFDKDNRHFFVLPGSPVRDENDGRSIDRPLPAPTRGRRADPASNAPYDGCHGELPCLGDRACRRVPSRSNAGLSPVADRCSAPHLRRGPDLDRRGRAGGTDRSDAAVENSAVHLRC